MNLPIPPAAGAPAAGSLPAPDGAPAGRRVPRLILRAAVVVTLTGLGLTAASGVYLAALRLLEWARGQTYTNRLTLWLFLGHLVIGIIPSALLVLFGAILVWKSRRRPGPLATGAALGFFFASAAALLAGLALVQFDGLPRLPTGSPQRALIYWLHVVAPPLATILYLASRRRAPTIRWRWGTAWGAGTALLVAGLLVWHVRHPRPWNVPGAAESEALYAPSCIRTVDGGRLPAGALMTDDYCRRCHEEAHGEWVGSAHHLASFNNPVYRLSVRETRRVGLARDGDVRAARWCAGCHDPVPLLSGAFDDPALDDLHDPTAQAGITCAACHAITHVNSTVGNADYTIEEPLHYPFAFSDRPLLRWLGDQAVKAKPEFHAKTFLKPLHRTPEFCSACHRNSLPMELNHYKEWMRGQDHYGTFLLSGASGHGARGFYYPAEAKAQCSDCHMPLRPSADFAARERDGRRTAHNHLFPGANTAVPWLASGDAPNAGAADCLRSAARAQADFLRAGTLRIDLFGLKQGGTIDGRLTAPLRPQLPALKPGAAYLVEVVIRTLDLGHQFPQGTPDANEIWVEVEARCGGRVIGRSGALDGPGDSGPVDEWAHFVNVLLLDRNGRRINRHNPQDIVAPLYDHQVPPGAAQVVHYRLEVPPDARGPVSLKARLRYRKINYEFACLVCAGFGPEVPGLLAGLPGPGGSLALAAAGLAQQRIKEVPALPIADICEDSVTLPVEGVAAAVAAQNSPIRPAWERWNDYGIGCYLEGGAGSKKGELRQAEQAFRQLLTLDDRKAHAHAYLNLARVCYDEGRLSEAGEALNLARTNDPPAPWWTVAWLTGLVNVQNGHLDEAIANFERVIDPANQPRERKFDFTRDLAVINELAHALFLRAQQGADPAARDRFLDRAVGRYEATLAIDREDLDAHYGLAQCFALLGEAARLPAVAPEPVAASAARLRELAAEFADPRLPLARRLEAAARLDQCLPRFAGAPANPAEPRLPVFLDLIARCRPVYGDHDGGPTRAAAARLLGQLHRRAHEVFKPDDNARDRTVRLYRAGHPAADHASQAVVIYPLRPPSP
jgi:tetratricopeptide (TPR) repeat protein